jgi:hypothetical protein
VDGLNAFEMVGGASTLRVAEAVLPAPALVEVTCTLFTRAPAVLPWTVTVTVQELLLGIDAEARLTEPAPPTAVTVAPEQVVPALGVGATTIPLGNVSVKATPFNVKLLLEFERVNVKVLVPPAGIEAGVKPLEIEGGKATVIEALAVLPAPALAEVTFPLTLFLTPPVVAVTFTATVHVPPAAMVPPLNVSVVSPAFGAKVPPHDVEAPGVEATCRPDGSESGKPTPNN